MTVPCGTTKPNLPREIVASGVPARMSYMVSFQKNGHEIETLYWNGSLEETRRLATQVAIECKADAFQIFDSTDAETPLETHPPLPKQPNGSEVV